MPAGFGARDPMAGPWQVEEASAVTDDQALVALLDGTLVDPTEPLLRPDDLGVLRGEGVFETTLVVDGQPRDLDEHLTRLALSAEMTGLVVPPADRWRRDRHTTLRSRPANCRPRQENRHSARP